MPDLTLALTELAATMPVAALSAGLVYFGWRLRNISAKSEIEFLRERLAEKRSYNDRPSN
jgi:MFS superfamily sulfate permease-like transporter